VTGVTVVKGVVVKEEITGITGIGTAETGIEEVEEAVEPVAAAETGEDNLSVGSLNKLKLIYVTTKKDKAQENAERSHEGRC
jgi:hypothetical protein